MNTLADRLAVLGEHRLLLAAALLLTKATILLAVAWCAHGLLDSANPRWRVLLWRSVGVGMVLLMVLTMSPPLLHWGVLPAETGGQPLAGAPAGQSEPPAASGAHAPSSSKPAASRSLGPGQREGVSDRQGSFGNPPIVITRNARHASRSSQSSTAVSTDRGSIAPVAEAELAPTRRVDGPAGNAAGTLFTWGAGLWLTGLVGLMGWTLFGLRRLKAILRRATPVPDWVGDLAAAVRAQLGCRQPFALRQTSEVGVPCLVGVRRPIVLLPVEQCDVSRRGELTAVLMHETAHLKGRDLPWNAVLHGLATLFWFHPLAWRIRPAHAGACDSVADTIAADLMGDVAGYGRTLARLAVRMHAPAPAAALAVTPISDVRRRIEALHRKLFRAPLPRTRVVTLVTLGAITVALLGGVALTRARGEPQPPVSSADKTSAKPQAEAETAPPQKTSPAASSDAATGDAELKQDRLTVHAVVDKTGKPLPGVKIRFHGRIGGEIYNRRLQTDEKGAASI